MKSHCAHGPIENAADLDHQESMSVIRERRRYEIARGVMASIVHADMMGAIEPGARPKYGFSSMASDSVRAADALLAELEK